MRTRSKRRVISPERLVGPLVAIVGRPNVGKSTLFNRLVGAPMAVVGPEEGTTRDRHYAGTEWEGRLFVLVDTGGFVAFDADRMDREIQRQVMHAIEEAALVILLVDAGPGPTDLDLALAKTLRKSGRPTLLMANKVDRPSDEFELHRFLALGLGEPYPVSALHGRQTGDVLDAIVARLPPRDDEETGGDEAAAIDEVSRRDADARIRIAVVGRPNVGKSSLVNRLLGMDRMIVDDTAGTTRDAVDTRAEIDGEKITLIDTAGLRRQARREPGIEYWSGLRSERAIGRSDIVLMIIEARDAGTSQDARIASLVEEMGRGIILVVTKWDMVQPGERDRGVWEDHLRQEFRFVPYAPLVFTSSVSGTGLERLVPLAARIWRERRRWLPDERVEEIMSGAVKRRTPSGHGRRGVLFAARQTGVAPPLFTLHVNHPLLFGGTYMRYLVNRMRREVPFEGTPIRFDVRTGRPRESSSPGPRGPVRSGKRSQAGAGS